jgi:NAD+ kinase
VGLIGNAEKAACRAVVRQAARLITSAGRKVVCDEETAGFCGLKFPTAADAAELAGKVDLLLVFGGDGTILRAARTVAGSETPLLGINIGSLGFLTAVPSQELRRALRLIWEGEFSFEFRTLLRAVCETGGRQIRETALNEFVIGRGMATRLIELDVKVDGEALTRYRCDGLIANTPTGSTAYSLAAGGAVIFPTSSVYSLTPICPHTLSNRSLILPLSATLEIRVITPKPATVLSADGQVITDLSAGDVISIRQSRRTVRLMHLAGSSFCKTLRRKLHWRGTPLPPT